MKWIILLALTLGLGHFASAVPLNTDYPRPLMASGPVPIRVPNLETPRELGPWKYDLPEGCTNIAFGKKVSASDEVLRHGELSMITDGDKGGEEMSEVVLNPGRVWIQIDLGKTAEVYAILGWHSHAFVRVYMEVIVQISNDPEFKTGVITIFNNDIKNLSGFGVGKDVAYIETNRGRLFDAKGQKARYVRLWSHGNTMDQLNRHIEVEVWGR